MRIPKPFIRAPDRAHFRLLLLPVSDVGADP